MRYLFLINIVLVFWSKFNRIAEMNDLKKSAEIYYTQKNYRKSIELYERLLTEYKETDETIKLNLANSYFHLKRYNNAIDNYKLLINSKNDVLKSNAYLQLGVIYSSNNKKELGLNYFREALKAMPQNDAARYNYELLKKDQENSHKDISENKKRENNKGENKTTASTSEESKKTNDGGKGQNNASQSSEEEEGDQENTGGEEEDELQYDKNGRQETDALTSQRLEKMHMNERQARMILKAMKSNEIQYIQQRKKIITSKQTPDKPDW